MAATALIWDLIATDNASGTFKKVGAEAEGAAGLVGKLATAISVAALVDIGVHMVSAATKFQSQMLLIQTQAGASSSEVKKMSDNVLNLAGTTATAPQTLASGLYAVESAGQRGATALDTLTVAAEGAKIGHADLTQTADALVAAIQSGIPGTEDAQKAMGALNATVGAGKMTLSDLNDALSTGVLPVMKGFGLSINDVGSALADMGDQGITGANAATALRMAVQAMAKPVAGGAAELKKLGLTQDQLGKDMSTGGLSKALEDLKSHMDNAGVKSDQVGQVMVDAFGKKAGVGLSVLVGNMGLYEQKVSQVKDGANGFGDAWTATTKTANFAFSGLRSEVDAYGIKVGTWLLPYVAKAATAIGTGLKDAVNWTTKEFQDHRGEIDKVGGLLETTLKKAVQDVTDTFHSALQWIEAHRALLQKVADVAGGALVGALKGASGAIHDIAQVLQGHMTLVATVAAGWIAYKGAIVLVGLAQGAWGLAQAGFGVLMDLQTKMIGGPTLALMNYVTQMEVTEEAQSVLVADSVATGEELDLALAPTFGPIGIIAGIAGLVGGAVAAFGIFGKGAHDQVVNVQSLTDAIKTDSGVLGDNSKALVTNALEKSGALDAARKLGISLPDVVTAALDPTSDAFKRVNGQMLQFSQGVYGSTQDTSGLIAAQKTLSAAIGGSNSNVASAVQANKNLTDASKPAQGAIATTAAAAKTASDNTSTLTQGLTNLGLTKLPPIIPIVDTGPATQAVSKFQTYLLSVITGQYKASVQAATTPIPIPGAPLSSTLPTGYIPIPGAAGGHASGTSNFGGGYTWINEGGPERIWLPKGAGIDSAQNSKPSGGNSQAVVEELQAQTTALTTAVQQLAQSIDNSVRGAATDGARATNLRGAAGSGQAYT